MEKYQPQSLAQLKTLVKDESVYLGDIDTSNITDMTSLFEPDVCVAWAGRKDFSGIESWNVSNVRDMSLMFHNCHFFNADISNWNVSSCESFYKMFGNCYLFNQPLGKWNTSKVRDVRYMFSMCASFKGDLNSWDISNLKETYGMFDDCNCAVPSWYNKMKG